MADEWRRGGKAVNRRGEQCRRVIGEQIRESRSGRADQGELGNKDGMIIRFQI